MSYTVLTVDDSPMTRAMIRKTLQMTGLPVTQLLEATNGNEGLEVAQAIRVDLLLADLNMPVMDGVEMIRRLSADPASKSVPVVVISADSDETRRAELRGMGVRGFVSKPFTPEKLREIFTSILGAA
ncbi:response regulator [Humisphaera borealis]|uniref:Response regulator n=1 Tax=Humisphaera borealis TaxID=2807512 RepID=A0A7M2X029_9BACT|nr:response regulator [Humisphaera borealis]QOV91039.1 response regulator [Humisphaera borealis]